MSSANRTRQNDGENEHDLNAAAFPTPSPSPSPGLSATEQGQPPSGLQPHPGQSLPNGHDHNVDDQPPPVQQRRHRSSSEARILKLSSRQIHDLIDAPDSLPLRPFDDLLCLDGKHEEQWHDAPELRSTAAPSHADADGTPAFPTRADPRGSWSRSSSVSGENAAQQRSSSTQPASGAQDAVRRSTVKQTKKRPSPAPLRLDETDPGLEHDDPSTTRRISASRQGVASPTPAIMPLPPQSLPTYLHLELSVDRPSALYIQPSLASEFPYESAAVKFERLRNFLRLPLHLEGVLVFGAVACLDAWLYTFTILPLRFVKALFILLKWMTRNLSQELIDMARFVYNGLGRLWLRERQRRQETVTTGSVSAIRASSLFESSDSRHDSSCLAEDESIQRAGTESSSTSRRRTPSNTNLRHRRTRSTPSVLLPSHKADLLQGLLIVASCIVLMWFDASRMYHSIRGQAAIKLYVIYNVLEVFDRLLSALGQDILECLFSRETLERDADGRSKVQRPFWMFLLALAYVISHSTALFYQVVTLNVAVNSYSNALLTLLMSNQFVEIKGTVFKKFEKENLFQLTCADVVERFQLWLMLLIIALRNIVEVGGLTISLGSSFVGESSTTPGQTGFNSTSLPLVSGFAIPKAFTLMPKWTGELLGPFLIVLGSEALVDWCKHAYITKFNNVKPSIYDRFLDVLAKDYYSHAFADQNLTKRLGLPIIPLSCLFMRAVVQTYHMFLATHVPVAIPSAQTAVSLNSDSEAASSATMAALHQFDQVLRRALGRSSFGAGTNPNSSFVWWSLDDFIALATMVIFFMVAFLVLLALKLALGMALLTYARNRYRDMKVREKENVDTHGRRLGGWGTVEVSEDKRRWIYNDDPAGLTALREKESKNRQKAEVDMKLDTVDRYSMVAKRIW